MHYLKKIVGFFVVSVFSMFGCLAMDAVPDSKDLGGEPQLAVLPVSNASSSVSSRDLRNSLFSPEYKPITLPMIHQDAVGKHQISVTVRGPVMPITPKVEIQSPVTILLSPSNGHMLPEDDALLSPTEILSPTVLTAANGSAVLAATDDTSVMSPRIEPQFLTRPRENSAPRMRMPTVFPSALRNTHRRRLSTDGSLSCQTKIDCGTSSMPSSLPPSPMMRTKRSAELPEDTDDVTEPDTKLILSIDGGGSRGIIPLEYLVELQEAIGQPLKFDMIAGTSVGAMIGAAVAMDKLPDMHDNFQDYVNRIFVKNWWSFWGLLRPTYSSEGRLQCIDEIAHDMNGRDMGTPFLAPFYSLLTREAQVYKNYGSGEEFKLKDVLMMTSAAPTYFNPHNCTSEKGTAYEGIDGGVFANHPGHIAYQEAKRLFPDSRICMLSLGTGMHNSCNGTNQSRNRGLVYWGGAFSEIAIEATSFLSNSALVDLAQTDPNFEYVRIQPSLEKSYMITDGTSPEHIKKLAAAVRRSIGTGGSEHDRFQAAQDMLIRHYDGEDNEEMSD